MATRPPDHPALAEPTITQPGAVSLQVGPSLPDRSASDRPPDKPDQGSEADNFLRLARDRWQTIDSAESVLRAKMREDLNFFASDQWPAKIANQRNQDGRPCLTINRQPGFVRQITNDMRDARPGIEVIPVDNGADPELAEVLQGVIAHIEANSDADVAYMRASEAQVRVGRGYFRILPEYADDTSFEQELRIKSIRNHATVYFDAASQELDGSDARYAFIVDDIPRDEYDARFGADTRMSLEQFARVGEQRSNWMPEGKIRVAEYYCFVPKTRTMVLLQNGMVVEAERLNDPAIQQALAQLGVPATPIRTREVEGRQLTWALINGAQVLDGNETKTGGREVPGRWIPIIPVYGEEIDKDGQVDVRGIVRDSIDAQRMSNYWKSAMTETVALAPRTPFIAAAGQIEGLEKEWQEANIRNFSVLQYKPQELAGHLIGPPQRQTSEPPIQAMAMLSMQAENDLRATAGFSYDVGAQEHRPEQSGKAILARQRQGEIGNSHFQAHLNVSLRHAGRILLDLIPSYYDTPRVKRILGRDGLFREVVIHAGNPQEAMQIAQKQAIAETQVYDLSAGRYDVRVQAGVSYASQRQEDRELMVNALQTNPNLMPLIGDLFFETLDTPIAKRIAKRLAKALPPALQESQDGQPPPIPPEVQQQLMQASQLVEALTQQLNAKTQELESKRDELASKERIAEIQAKTDMAITQAKIAAEVQLAQLDATVKQTQTQAQLEGQARLADQKLSFDREESEREREDHERERETTTQMANQKLQADDQRLTRQLQSQESQTGATLGAEAALALLDARMKQIEQLVGLDMARLQMDHETQMAEQARAEQSPPSASAPASGKTSPEGRSG